MHNSLKAEPAHRLDHYFFEEMSPFEAACAVIRMELMRATDRVQ